MEKSREDGIFLLKDLFFPEDFKFFRLEILSYCDRIQAVIAQLPVEFDRSYISGGSFDVERFRIRLYDLFRQPDRF